MFTRYNGIDVPKNYSGNRFRQELETEMKTHKAPLPQTAPAVTKSSPPQSFQSVIDKAAQGDIADQAESIDAEAAPIEIESPDPVSIIEPALVTDDTAPTSDSLESSGLKALFESLKGDDLLLIALILLLSGNEGYENKELIVTLALLLLYR